MFREHRPSFWKVLTHRASVRPKHRAIVEGDFDFFGTNVATRDEPPGYERETTILTYLRYL